MAMTKKEQAAMKEAIDKAETLAALRWTSDVERDVIPPEGGSQYSEGWDYNAHSKRVWKAWSGTVTHGEGDAPKEGQKHYSASQNARRLYSTKMLALMAMRHEVEKAAASDLLAIDREIEKARIMNE